MDSLTNIDGIRAHLNRERDLTDEITSMRANDPTAKDFVGSSVK